MKPEVEALSAELADEIELKEEMVVGLLAEYVVQRDLEAGHGKHKSRLSELIKGYLERHPDERLWDGEHAIEARLQDRSLPGRACDLNALYSGDLQLFQQLLLNGCLRVDEGSLKKAGALVAGIERYLGPKGSTKALVVEQK